MGRKPVDRHCGIVIIADPGREREAALRLGRIGFDHVVGYLERGMLSLRDRSDLTESTERVSPRRAADEMGAADPPALIDVRSSQEYEAKQVPGSLNVPLNRLLEWVPTERRPRACTVRRGYRLSIAASLLRQRGMAQVSEVSGGLAAWEAAELPVRAR